MATVPPHVARIVDADPAALWADVTPDASRRLLLAALDAFGQLGFEGATTRTIAQRAEMSAAAVYFHYAAKVDLLERIVVIAHEAAWSAVTSALGGVAGPTRRLRTFAEAFAAWHACNHTLGRVAQYELAALPPERMASVGELRRRFERLVRRELRAGVELEGFAVENVPGTALAIVSLGIDVVRWYAPEGRMGVAELARLHGELTVRMVQPWAAAGTAAPPGVAPAAARV